MVHDKHAMNAAGESDVSLFRVVDASDVEATVLRNAEKRVRDSDIPPFIVSRGLGFSSASLGRFCADTDSLILRIVADAARHEGRQLRESGVANLAARDRVQMKEQILKGLLQRRNIRSEFDENPKESPGAAREPDGAASARDSDGTHDDVADSLGGDWQRREELIRTGAITPLDDVTSRATPPRPLGRVSFMEHKIAEGMTVKLPRSHRVRARSGAGVNDTSHADGDLTMKHAAGGSPAGVSALPRHANVADELVEQREGCDNFCPVGETECGIFDESKVKHGTPPTSSRRRSRNDVNNEEQGVLQNERRGGQSNAIQCPLCTQRVHVDDSTNPDVSLSKHVDRCNRRRSHGMVSGQASKGFRAWQESGSTTNHLPKDLTRTKRLARKGGNINGHVQHELRVRDQAEPRTSQSKDTASSRPTGGIKRRRATPQETTPRDLSDTSDKEVVLKVLTGGQALVDDSDDADFDERKEQINETPPMAAVAEEESKSADRVADLGNGLVMETGIAQRLFQFQLTGVRWMWQLHRQGAGGIVGDEMGLGKTVQVASFLGALHRSGVVRRALVLCPATVLSHWLSELHAWAPQLRVVVLHRCAQAFDTAAGNSGKLRTLVRRVLGWPNVVVVTSYEGLKSLKSLLLPLDWDYGIVDEGQRIRNPDAQVTLLCKQIRTVHRLVLTGTPIQNNLRELWSLFDFVFPGRLGTLPAFEAEFAGPIRVGGYANASPMQARLAYRCALVLRDLIHPYLLRRQKKDLEEVIRLPAKTEQVLFCRLTSYQRRLYSEFLASTEVKSVLSRTMRAFRAIGILRKLCNHPDLACRVGDSLATRFVSQSLWADNSNDSEGNDDLDGGANDEHGAPERSGKLLVLKQILPLWHKQGHRVLLFSQTRQMLNILESFVKSMNWSYGRLDGSTPVGRRQNLIDRFNSDDSVFLMLLTTRTGGVGVNLTGADRVILFDPDWNPSTDMQARERSWRVGQIRQVTIYRLITAGTIEEKIYHRQIFKTALTNRVLQDPKQRRMFSAHELGDLFTLGDDGSLDGFTDTVDLFQGEGKIDAPNADQGASRQWQPEVSGSRKGKRPGKSARCRQRRDSSGSRSAEDTDPSPLLGTATVVLEPRRVSGESLEGIEDDRDVDKSKSDDSAVLQALYDGAPLSSVFHHDLAEGSGTMSAEQRRMEDAAKRAAQRAVNQLRMSRHTLRAGAGQGGFQSSWTGRNGGAAADSSRQVGPRNSGTAARRFGTVSISNVTGGGLDAVAGLGSDPSGREESLFDRERRGSPSTGGQSSGVTSQDILRQIRERNQAQPAQASGLFPEFQDPGPSEDRDTHYAALLQRLQDYLAQAPSGIDTAALIHKFGNLPPSDVPVFRQMLQAIAVCNNGEWTLREAPNIG